MERIKLQIRRQDTPSQSSYWQEFELDVVPQMTLITALNAIRRNPVDSRGRDTTPVAWDSNCLEEVCGACTMLINGKPAQACSILVENLPSTTVLEPLTKFPVVRDLIVDRSGMTDNLKKVHGWIEIDGTHNLGPGPVLAESDRRHNYELSNCIMCGSCLETCPQVNSHSPFMGPAIMNQVVLLNSHPTGDVNREERLESVMGREGIVSCGHAQTCQAICPKDIPLLSSLGRLARQTTWYGLKKMLGH